MTPAAALRSEAAAHALDRLLRALPAAAAVRWIAEDREGPIIAERPTPIAPMAWLMQQEAYDHDLATARRSRSLECLRIGHAQAFTDALGLAYCCAPFQARHDTGFVLVTGPIAPLEGAVAMERDVRRGLESLDLIGPGDPVPFPLFALPAMPIETALSLTEWTAERLTAIIADAAGPPVAEPAPKAVKPADWTPNTPRPAPYDADLLATAMAAGDSARLRAILRAEAAESDGRKRVKQAVARARVLAALAAGLEGAERAGLKTATAWSRMPKALEEIQAGQGAEDWVDAAMRVFGAIARKKPKQPPADPKTAALHDWLLSRLPEGLTLNEAAAALGEDPTAITHRLQRKFGLSFSQYVNRLRLDKAKELLRTTKLSVATIAQRVGVGDPSNLGRIFRSIERISPGEYRKRFGKGG